MTSGYHHLIANEQEKTHPIHHPTMKEHHPNEVDMIMMIDHHVKLPKNPEEKVNVAQHESHRDQDAIQVVTVIVVIVVNLHQKINLEFAIMHVKLFEKQLVIRHILGIPIVIQHQEIQVEEHQKNHRQGVQEKNEGQVVIEDQPMLDLVQIQQQQQVDQAITQHQHPITAVQRNGIVMMTGIEIVVKRDTGRRKKDPIYYRRSTN